MDDHILLDERCPVSEESDLSLGNFLNGTIVGEESTLEAINVTNAKISTFKGIPNLPHLTKLELPDNSISCGLSHLVTNVPQLAHLNLSGNRIGDVEELKPLRKLKQLHSLSLFNNEVTSIENYRQEVFGLIKSLKCLDGYGTEKFDAECDNKGESEDAIEVADEETYDDDIDDEEGYEDEEEEDNEDIYHDDFDEDTDSIEESYGDEDDDIDSEEEKY